MSTCRHSSMHICMCQHCTTQKHSSPEVDRQGVSFRPLQYKHHIKQLKSAIAPKSLPNIPTSASGSQCPENSIQSNSPCGLSSIDPKHILHTTGSQFNCTETIMQQSKTSPIGCWNGNICHSIIKV
ncbi:hypothetical protein O181_067959 [Austropuccinia psidii MF-1]|uniref:Uncharacterized protein n=1 Tax=Austropuccinia psidii MF-1 TaxID=1389203 RepID=A0A9Q3EWD7_9BASI|nr:hypothetical protein [Austropuccinia psidii MF-1]